MYCWQFWSAELLIWCHFWYSVLMVMLWKNVFPRKWACYWIWVACWEPNLLFSARKSLILSASSLNTAFGCSGVHFDNFLWGLTNNKNAMFFVNGKVWSLLVRLSFTLRKAVFHLSQFKTVSIVGSIQGTLYGYFNLWGQCLSLESQSAWGGRTPGNCSPTLLSNRSSFFTSVYFSSFLY